MEVLPIFHYGEGGKHRLVVDASKFLHFFIAEIADMQMYVYMYIVVVRVRRSTLSSQQNPTSMNTGVLFTEYYDCTCARTTKEYRSTQSTHFPRPPPHSEKKVLCCVSSAELLQ